MGECFGGVRIRNDDRGSGYFQEDFVLGMLSHDHT